MTQSFFKSDDKAFTLIHDDVFECLNRFEFQFDMVFADPPYFLSNGGETIKDGRIQSVNKGTWDVSEGYDSVNKFNKEWLRLVRDKMRPNGTIWVSGTSHNIFSVGQMLSELDFKILNIVTWEKTNPPPNFSCRYFTHSAEHIIWARKEAKTPHYYNYQLMKQLNSGKQMKDVWRLPAIARWEKSCGKHPTQKPLALLTRILLASTQKGAWVLDPFTGSSTTGVAANLLGRRFLGIDSDIEFLKLSKARKLEIQDSTVATNYISKLKGFNDSRELATYLVREPSAEYAVELKI